LCFCVLDTIRNKYIAFRSYSAQKTNTLSNLSSEIIEEWVTDNSVLSWQYRSISCMINDNKHTLIPSALFDESKQESYLKFNLQVEERSYVPPVESKQKIGNGTMPFLVAKDKLRNLDAVNLFVVSKSINEVLNAKFNSVRIMHASSSLIESILMRYKNKNRELLILNYGKSSFDMLVLKDNSIRLFNSYPHQTKEDFVYFVLFACEQLKLNPEQVELIMMGGINRKSEYYALLKTYVRNLRFSDRNKSFEYSYILTELPEHYYYNLFSQYQCVS